MTANRPPIVHTDAQGVVVVQQGDAGAKLPPVNVGKQRYETEPVRWAMQTGWRTATRGDDHDIRGLKTFGVK